MGKYSVFVVAFSISILVLYCSSFAADRKTEKIYELAASTSTPENYKRMFKRSIAKNERMEVMRANSRRAATKRLSTAVHTAKSMGLSSVVVLTADPAFKLGEVYCYPNPAKKTAPTFHIEAGIADKVDLKLYDTSGHLVHATTLTAPPQVINDGQGDQYAYEYLWNTGNYASGVYVFYVTASKDGADLKKTGRCAVIK